MTPEKMQLICNIQTMSRHIGHEYSFEFLEAENVKQLRQRQEELIPLYNEAVKRLHVTKTEVL